VSEDGGPLAHTPLWPRHQAAGAKLVPFAGFSMPVVYTSIPDNRAVRTRAGLFDVSHMGEVRLRGAGALELAQTLLTNDVLDAPIGRVRYGMLCQDDGGVVDDVTLYRTGEREVLFCVNASNIAADLAWMRELHARTKSPCELVDESDATALLALQGPEALGIVAKLLPPGFTPPKLWHFARARLGSSEVLLSRTGYTGEDGYEIFTAADQALALWDLARRRRRAARRPASARATPCAPRQPCPSTATSSTASTTRSRQVSSASSPSGAASTARWPCARAPVPGRAGASRASCSTAARWRERVSRSIAKAATES
jgi:glycine cleavage system aminomethyltransferase T